MFSRYAIFYTFPAGPLAETGARWLGWDSLSGRETEPFDLDGLNPRKLTRKARKYGFHGTLKAPFRLAPSVTKTRLLEVAQTCAARLSPAPIPNLSLVHKHGFLALRAQGDQSQLNACAAQIVRDFDPLRAELTESDIAKRNPARLSERQRAQMLEWGYPYVFDDFEFHMTLSSRVADADAQNLIARMIPLFTPHIPSSLHLDALTVLGEGEDNRFHQIARFPYGQPPRLG